MAMRNFWVVTRVDGRKTEDGTGPRGKSGGIKVDIAVNDDGTSKNAVRVIGYVAEDDNTLVLLIDVDGQQTIRKEYCKDAAEKKKSTEGV